MLERINCPHTNLLLNQDCSSYCCYHYCQKKKRTELNQKMNSKEVLGLSLEQLLLVISGRLGSCPAEWGIRRGRETVTATGGFGHLGVCLLDLHRSGKLFSIYIYFTYEHNRMTFRTVNECVK